jgi:hypothetical protein
LTAPTRAQAAARPRVRPDARARAAEAPASALADLVDLGRYPIHRPGDPAHRALLADCRARLSQTGCLVLADFLRPDGLARLAEETRALAPGAHHRHTRTNAYDTEPAPDLPADHPRNVFLDRSNGFVAGDRIGPETGLRRLFHDPELKAFVAACAGLPEVHEYADPLADLVVNVLRPGCQHPWHFDTNEFVVSILTQEPEGGGAFEYCPGIRSETDENAAAVGDVVNGRSDRPRTLTLRPGDLQIFFGRFSLHRVARVEGRRERHTVILGYAKEPGVIGKPGRTRTLFGRLAPVHEAAEAGARRSDGLED